MRRIIICYLIFLSIIGCKTISINRTDVLEGKIVGGRLVNDTLYKSTGIAHTKIENSLIPQDKCKCNILNCSYKFKVIDKKDKIVRPHTNIYRIIDETDGYFLLNHVNRVKRNGTVCIPLKAFDKGIIVSGVGAYNMKFTL